MIVRASCFVAGAFFLVTAWQTPTATVLGDVEMDGIVGGLCYIDGTQACPAPTEVCKQHSCVNNVCPDKKFGDVKHPDYKDSASSTEKIGRVGEHPTGGKIHCMSHRDCDGCFTEDETENVLCLDGSEVKALDEREETEPDPSTTLCNIPSG